MMCCNARRTIQAEAEVARLQTALEDARAFLANPTAAREAAYVEALDLELEAVESSIHNLEQCPSSKDTHCNDVTRVHDRLLRQREDLERILADPSPAAAALLAQAKIGREHVAWSEDSQRVLNRMCEVYGEGKREVRALLAQGDLAANLAQRLQEARDRKVLLNGMTQEQKAAVFDIKAIVSDGVRHYESACAALAPVEEKQ